MLISTSWWISLCASRLSPRQRDPLHGLRPDPRPLSQLQPGAFATFNPIKEACFFYLKKKKKYSQIG